MLHSKKGNHVNHKMVSFTFLWGWLCLGHAETDHTCVPMYIHQKLWTGVVCVPMSILGCSITWIITQKQCFLKYMHVGVYFFHETFDPPLKRGRRLMELHITCTCTYSNKLYDITYTQYNIIHVPGLFLVHEGMVVVQWVRFLHSDNLRSLGGREERMLYSTGCRWNFYEIH